MTLDRTPPKGPKTRSQTKRENLSKKKVKNILKNQSNKDLQKMETQTVSKSVSDEELLVFEDTNIENLTETEAQTSDKRDSESKDDKIRILEESMAKLLAKFEEKSNENTLLKEMIEKLTETVVIMNTTVEQVKDRPEKVESLLLQELTSIKSDIESSNNRIQSLEAKDIVIAANIQAIIDNDDFDALEESVNNRFLEVEKNINKVYLNNDKVLKDVDTSLTNLKTHVIGKVSDNRKDIQVLMNSRESQSEVNKTTVKAIKTLDKKISEINQTLLSKTQTTTTTKTFGFDNDNEEHENSSNDGNKTNKNTQNRVKHSKNRKNDDDFDPPDDSDESNDENDNRRNQSSRQSSHHSSHGNQDRHRSRSPNEELLYTIVDRLSGNREKTDIKIEPFRLRDCAKTWIEEFERKAMFPDLKTDLWKKVIGCHMSSAHSPSYQRFYINNIDKDWNDYRNLFINHFQSVEVSAMARMELQSLDPKKFKSRDAYFNKCFELVDIIGDSDGPSIGLSILKKFPLNVQRRVDAKGLHLSPREIIQNLRQADQRERNMLETSESNTSKPNKSKSFNDKRNPNKGKFNKFNRNSTQNSSQNSRFNFECHHCGIKGHKSADCRKRKRELENRRNGT